MNTLKKPGTLTAIFLAVLLSVLFFRSHGWKLPTGHSAPQTPEDAVYSMLDAARTGDTSVYLETFSGPLQQQIQQAVRESGKGQFGDYLRKQSASFESVALSTTDQPSDQEARLRVEYIYLKRNEVQNFHLRKIDARWKVVAISGTDLTRTLIPWGTAVTDD